MQNNNPGIILGLDVGDVRIGVARAHTIARLPEPICVIDVRKQDYIKEIKSIAQDLNAQSIIVGLPRLYSGSDSEQTKKVRMFVDNLKKTYFATNYLYR